MFDRRDGDGVAAQNGGELIGECKHRRLGVRRDLEDFAADVFCERCRPCDGDEIVASGFPVFARGRAIRGTAKQADAPGALATPITIGRAAVAPGNLIVGDADGVVVLTSETLSKVLAAARSREQMGVAFLVHEVELHARHPALVLLTLFLVFELAFVLVASILMPGVIKTLGPVRVGMANLLAAASMALFLVISHRPDLWQRLRHAAHLG